MRIALGRESFFKAAGALGAAAPILESISNPSGGAGWSWVGCGCEKDLISDQIPACLVPRIGGIKLQLLRGVKVQFSEICNTFLTRSC